MGREFIRSIKRANLKLTLTIAKSKDIYIHIYIFLKVNAQRLWK